MKSWIWAIILFFYGYAIGTVLGFGLYYINEIVMWSGIFTLMPVIFIYLVYLYLKKVNCSKDEAFKETMILISFWIFLSFGLDALFYILVFPIIFGADLNRTFFIDQSPWIWVSYLLLSGIGYAGFRIFIRAKNNYSN